MQRPQYKLKSQNSDREHKLIQSKIIFFRCDASLTIGSGHVMRCLTLAICLREAGHRCYFICQDLPGSLCDHIYISGFKCFVLEKRFFEDCLLSDNSSLQKLQQIDAELTTEIIIKVDRRPDLLVVDHYLLDRRWQTICKQRVETILVIDDLADRQHDCQFLLDQNYYTNATLRYKNLTSAGCQHFTGPEFMLLRDEFFTNYEDKKTEGIFVSFGGVDRHDMTFLIVNELLQSFPEIKIQAVIGAYYSGKVRSLIDNSPQLEIYQSVEGIGEIMSSCKLSIGAGGATIFEKQSLGLASIAYSVADNQRQTLIDLHKGSFIKYLGHYDTFDADELSLVINNFLQGKLKMRVLNIQDGKRKLIKEIIG